MVVHIDCNAFFASCEIAQNPELENRPVVVANDNEVGGGIILALNDKAKLLGLKRGNPLFQVRSMLEHQKVEICRVNHRMYRQISHQIMENVKNQEVVLDFVQYSIDEFFGSIPVEEPEECARYVLMVKDMIKETTGIPVSCGCASTYTLAKVATYFAKRFPAYGGVCVIPEEKRLKALSLISINDIWGVGRASIPKMEQLKVRSALDFVMVKEDVVRRQFNTSGVNTWLELQGVKAVTITSHDKQKSIMQSHTFGKMLESEEELEPYITKFVSECAVKLRAQKTLCTTVAVFLSTNRHRNDLPQYRNSVSMKLDHPLADTPTLIKMAHRLLHESFRRGYFYKQAGVVLGGIIDENGSQMDLFESAQDAKMKKLMEVADEINKKYGDSTINFGK